MQWLQSELNSSRHIIMLIISIANLLKHTLRSPGSVLTLLCVRILASVVNESILWKQRKYTHECAQYTCTLRMCMASVVSTPICVGTNQWMIIGQLTNGIDTESSDQRWSSSTSTINPGSSSSPVPPALPYQHNQQHDITSCQGSKEIGEPMGTSSSWKCINTQWYRAA